MTKKQILEQTGLSEAEFYAAFPTQQAYLKKYGYGGGIRKYSSGGPLDSSPGIDSDYFSGSSSNNRNRGASTGQISYGGQPKGTMQGTDAGGNAISMAPDGTKSGGSMNATNYIGAANSGVQGISNVSSIYNNPNSTTRQKTESINDATFKVIENFGVQGQAIKLGYDGMNAIMRPERDKAEAMDDQGNLKDPTAARNRAISGAFFDPLQAMTTRLSYKGGLWDISGKGYTKNLEKEAKKGLDLRAPWQKEQDTQLQLQTQMSKMGGKIYDPYKYNEGSYVNPNFMSKFADGGMTQGNVEHGEMLIDSNSGDILTEYAAPNMPRHPKDGGMDDRGTVPLPSGQFITTVLDSKRYKKARETNDKTLMAAIFNNTTIKKNQKEVEETMGVLKDIDKTMKKFKEGAYIEKYNDGDITGDLRRYKNRHKQLRREDERFLRNSTKGFNKKDKKFAEEMYNSYKSDVEKGTFDENESLQNKTAKELYSESIGHYRKTNYPNSNNKSNILGDALPYLPTAALLAEAIMSKPYKVNPEDFKVKSRLSAYETPLDYRHINEASNKASYDLRNVVGNAGNYGAARTALAGTTMKAASDYTFATNEGNAARKMTADQFNIDVEGQNLSTGLQLEMFNEQNRANRRNAIRELAGKDLPATFYNQQQNKILMNSLQARYPDYQFNFGVFDNNKT